MTATSTYPKRVIAAALFDALKGTADAVGGIGCGRMYESSAYSLVGAPLCFFGLLHKVGFFSDAQLAAAREEAEYTLLRPVPRDSAHILFSRVIRDPVQQAFGLSWPDSDHAVIELGGGPDVRVPFDVWAKYFNIHRAVELPAAAYDALKASSEKHGGIGAETFEAKKISPQSDNDEAVPYCIAGHAALIDTGDTLPDGPMPTLRALQRAFGLGSWSDVYDVNDAAVHAINARKGLLDATRVTFDETTRVTFDEWTAELNVVRGAE